MYALIWPPRSFAFAPWPLGGGRVLPDPWWGDLIPSNSGAFPSEPTELLTDWPKPSWMNGIWCHVSFSWPCLQCPALMNHTGNSLHYTTVLRSFYFLLGHTVTETVVIRSVRWCVKWFLPGKPTLSCNLAFLVRGDIRSNTQRGKERQRAQMKGRDLEN